MIAEPDETKYRLNFHQSLLSCVHDAILAIDENLTLIYYNAMAVKLTGWPESEVLGRHSKVLFEKMNLNIPWENLIAMLDEKGYYEGELLARRQDGQNILVEVYVKRMYGLCGEFCGTVATFRDITDRKLAENILRNREVQSRDLANTLENRNKHITDYFTNISHEFKTPLSILLLAIDLLNKKLDNDKFNKADIVKNLVIMRQNAYRLTKLVSNLIDITKLDAGFLEPTWEMNNIVDWLRKLVKSTELYARQKGLVLAFHCSAKEKWMYIDGFILDRIILNLLSNSIKHTLRGGKIEVVCVVENDNIRITVKDTGEGIPEDKKHLIFNRFRQVNTTLTRVSEGSGIGLALTKSMVELLGGNIAFQSTVGVGSEFVVDLPVLQIEKMNPSVGKSGMDLDKRIQMELSDVI